MSCHPNIEHLVTYGKEAEEALAPLLSQIVGDTLLKTGSEFDSLDFQGDHTFAELKRRSDDWSYTHPKIQQEGWLIPSCKIMRGWTELAKGRKVFFFYAWDCDRSVWMYELAPGDFTSGGHFIPKGHYDAMLHVAVPQSRWTRLPVEAPWKAQGCWID
jgi:hypothetical protein